MAQTAIKQRDENHAEAPGRGSHGTFCWNELMTRDVERAKKFYEETIGWTFSPMPMADGGTYWCAMVEGKPIAGMFPIKNRNSTACRKAGCPISRSTTWISASPRRLRPAPSS